MHCQPPRRTRSRSQPASDQRWPPEGGSARWSYQHQGNLQRLIESHLANHLMRYTAYIISCAALVTVQGVDVTCQDSARQPALPQLRTSFSTLLVVQLEGSERGRWGEPGRQLGHRGSPWLCRCSVRHVRGCEAVHAHAELACLLAEDAHFPKIDRVRNTYCYFDLRTLKTYRYCKPTCTSKKRGPSALD